MHENDIGGMVVSDIKSTCEKQCNDFLHNFEVFYSVLFVSHGIRKSFEKGDNAIQKKFCNISTIIFWRKLLCCLNLYAPK